MTHTLFPARLRIGTKTIEPARAYLDPLPDGSARVVVLAEGEGRPIATVRRRQVGAVLAETVPPGAWTVDRKVWTLGLDTEVVVDAGAGCGCGHPLKTYRLDEANRTLLVEEGIVV